MNAKTIEELRNILALRYDELNGEEKLALDHTVLGLVLDYQKDNELLIRNVKIVWSDIQGNRVKRIRAKEEEKKRHDA